MVASLPSWIMADDKCRPYAIKLLDLLTNRYHVGVVHATSGGNMAIEMPRSARLNAGQRVRYVLADNPSAVISRHSMRQALVCHVDASDGLRLRADLAMTEDGPQNPNFS